jgi:GH25 family lysozyme M1 (1,4-beta-N-acetylmuramidase)
MRRLSLGLCLALGIGAAVPAAAAPSGPDVSSWQHVDGRFVNWFAVAASGNRFAMLKATEGLGYVNPYFVVDSVLMRAAGVARGVYHYGRPAQSPELQAALFSTVVLGENGPLDLPPVLDLETTDGLNPPAMIDWTHRYLNAVRLLTGRTPIVYTYPRFWRTAMADSHEFVGYPLWIADYNKPAPILPGGWHTWTFWQRTDCGHVPGIAGCADIDVYNPAAGDFGILANLPSGSS